MKVIVPSGITRLSLTLLGLLVAVVVIYSMLSAPERWRIAGYVPQPARSAAKQRTAFPGHRAGFSRPD